jgi:hypothetical protein
MIILLFAGGISSFLYMKKKGAENVQKDQNKINNKSTEVISETNSMSDDELDANIKRKLGDVKYAERK